MRGGIETAPFLAELSALSDARSIATGREEKEITRREGELWWFDNKALHEAWNRGDRDRIHLIFDMKPAYLPDAMMLHGASDLA